MKILSKITMLLTAAVALTACQNPEKTIVDPANIKAAVITSYPKENVVLNSEKPDDSQITIAWDAAQYGYSAAITYTVMIYIDGVDGGESFEVGQTNKTSIEIKTKTLNNALVNGLKAEAELPFKFNAHIICSIGAQQYNATTAQIELSVTSYKVPTPLWVPGDYCSWHDKDLATIIYSMKSDEVYAGWVGMFIKEKAKDEIISYKLTTEKGWKGSNYGGTLEALSTDGGNLEAKNGYLHYLEIDLNTLTGRLANSITSIGIVGSATANGWDGPDTQLEYDYETRTFIAKGVKLVEGEFKFRANNSWGGIDWGKGEKDGELFYKSGPNIAFNGDEAFTYKIVVDPQQLIPTYSVSAEK